MSLKTLIANSTSNFYLDYGTIHSVDPPETLFGALYFAQMIPPFKPDSTLILGYGHGTVAHLMRKIWGSDLKITGIDLQKYDLKFIEYKMKVMDANEYVKDCTDSIFKTKYDYICVDLWNGNKVPDFVFQAEFAVRLKEMCTHMICLNIDADDFRRLSAFKNYGFEFVRHCQIEKTLVVWWSI